MEVSQTNGQIKAKLQRRKLLCIVMAVGVTRPEFRSPAPVFEVLESLRDKFLSHDCTITIKQTMAGGQSILKPAVRSTKQLVVSECGT